MVLGRTLLGLWCWFPGLLLHPFFAYKAYFALGGIPESPTHVAIVAITMIGSGFVGSKLLK